MIVVATLEAPAVVTGLDDLAMVGQPIEQRSGHLGVAEHAGPFAESEVRGDDDRGPLIEPTNEVEQELAAGLGEGQIAEFVEDDEVHTRQMIGETTLPSVTGLGLEPVDEIDHVVEPAAGAAADAASGNGDGKICLAGAGPADQHGVALLGDKAAASEIIDERLIDRCAFELEVVEVLGERQLSSTLPISGSVTKRIRESPQERVGNFHISPVMPGHR